MPSGVEAPCVLDGFAARLKSCPDERAEAGKEKDKVPIRNYGVWGTHLEKLLSKVSCAVFWMRNRCLII
jgi:hypothetical protein